MGIDPLRAAGMMALMVGISIPARFIGGLIADRVRRNHMRFIIGGAYLLQAIGLSIFLLNQQSIAMIYAWFIFYGNGLGMGTMYITMLARYFGRKAYGSIRGSQMMLMALGGMAAPIYAGWVYDTTGTYITAFFVFAGVIAASAVIMSLAIPPKPPAHVTNVHKIV